MSFRLARRQPSQVSNSTPSDPALVVWEKRLLERHGQLGYDGRATAQARWEALIDRCGKKDAQEGHPALERVLCLIVRWFMARYRFMAHGIYEIFPQRIKSHVMFIPK